MLTSLAEKSIDEPRDAIAPSLVLVATGPHVSI